MSLSILLVFPVWVGPRPLMEVGNTLLCMQDRPRPSTKIEALISAAHVTAQNTNFVMHELQAGQPRQIARDASVIVLDSSLSIRSITSCHSHEEEIDSFTINPQKRAFKKGTLGSGGYFALRSPRFPTAGTLKNDKTSDNKVI